MKWKKSTECAVIGWCISVLLSDWLLPCLFGSAPPGCCSEVRGCCASHPEAPPLPQLTPRSAHGASWVTGCHGSLEMKTLRKVNHVKINKLS